MDKVRLLVEFSVSNDKTIVVSCRESEESAGKLLVGVLNLGSKFVVGDPFADDGTDDDLPPGEGPSGGLQLSTIKAFRKIFQERTKKLRRKKIIKRKTGGHAGGPAGIAVAGCSSSVSVRSEDVTILPIPSPRKISSGRGSKRDLDSANMRQNSSTSLDDCGKEEKTVLSPSHIIINKTENINKDLGTLASLQDEHEREYEKLETFVQKHINPGETTSVAKTEENVRRNRYLDMLPFDSNIVYLSSDAGFPASRYINASWVNFPTLEQKIIAIEAPRENMFDGFWQLVVEQNVGLIVMITRLEEKGRRKADQYWPTKKKKFEFDNGIRVKLKHEHCDTDLIKRELEVSSHGSARTVHQLHCEAWGDREAPKDTKVLLELYVEAEEVLSKNPGNTMMVHCSAGVGRTGTFIGLFKLVKDFEDDTVTELDPFETVLTMRRQRMKMVQKPRQYNYMFRCLAHYVTGNDQTENSNEEDPSITVRETDFKDQVFLANNDTK